MEGKTLEYLLQILWRNDLRASCQQPTRCNTYVCSPGHIDVARSISHQRHSSEEVGPVAIALNVENTRADNKRGDSSRAAMLIHLARSSTASKATDDKRPQQGVIGGHLTAARARNVLRRSTAEKSSHTPWQKQNMPALNGRAKPSTCVPTPSELSDTECTPQVTFHSHAKLPFESRCTTTEL